MKYQKLSPNTVSTLNQTARRMSLLGAIGLLALGGISSGCSEADSSNSTPTSPAGVLAVDADGVQGFTITDLPVEMDLSSEQSEEMAAAIDELNSERDRMRSKIEGARGRVRDEGPGRIREMIQDRLARGDRPEPPMIEFLETSAEVLDADQFVILAEFLGERRDAKTSEFEGRRDQFKRGMPEMLALKLGLTDEQRDDLVEILQDYGADLREIKESAASGDIGVEAAISQATQLVQAMKDDLGAVLTAEQLAELESLKQERIANMIERRLENLEANLSRRAVLITNALDLEDGQAAQVESILLGTVSSREELLNGVADGTIPPQVAALTVIRIEQGAIAEIESVLTPEQQAQLDAVLEILPRGARNALRG